MQMHLRYPSERTLVSKKSSQIQGTRHAKLAGRPIAGQQRDGWPAAGLVVRTQRIGKPVDGT